MRALPSGCTPHLSLPYPEKLLCRTRLRMLPPRCIPQVITTTNCREYQLFLPCPHTVPADPGRPLESPSRCSFPNKVLPSPPIQRCSRCLLPPSSCHRHPPAASFAVSSLARPPLLAPPPHTRLTVSPVLSFLPRVLSLLRKVLEVDLSLLRLSVLTLVCFASSLISIIILVS